MSEEKVNWEYYICRKCGKPADAHMISEQFRLRLCDKCYTHQIKEK